MFVVRCRLRAVHVVTALRRRNLQWSRDVLDVLRRLRSMPAALRRRRVQRNRDVFVLRYRLRSVRDDVYAVLSRRGLRGRRRVLRRPPLRWNPRLLRVKFRNVCPHRRRAVPLDFGLQPLCVGNGMRSVC